MYNNNYACTWSLAGVKAGQASLKRTKFYTISFFFATSFAFGFAAFNKFSFHFILF